MKKDLLTELQKTTRKAIDRKRKPKYWDMLVSAMQVSAANGYYDLYIYGKLFDNRAGFHSDTDMILDDILNHQVDYASIFEKNGLHFEIRMEYGPLPAAPLDPLGVTGKFTEVHVKIKWSDEK